MNNLRYRLLEAPGSFVSNNFILIKSLFTDKNVWTYVFVKTYNVPPTGCKHRIYDQIENKMADLITRDKLNGI
jgi:hypothetical protein